MLVLDSRTNENLLKVIGPAYVLYICSETHNLLIGMQPFWRRVSTSDAQLSLLATGTYMKVSR
jgi:hypothetical protein